MRGLFLLLALLPLAAAVTCRKFAIRLSELGKYSNHYNTTLKEKTIECEHYCVQNITHADQEMWLVSGCGTLECRDLLTHQPACHRSSAIEKTHVSLYHYSCCGKDDMETPAWKAFIMDNNTQFLTKTAAQSLPREEIPIVVYVRTAVAALFAIAAIATQVIAVRLYRKKQ